MLQGGHSQRFEREAQAIAALNHPHICTLYDVGPDYLVMEYVEGAPIRGPLPAGGSSAVGDPDRRGARRSALEEDRASRSQAGEHPGDKAQGEGARLRPRQAGGRGRRRRCRSRGLGKARSSGPRPTCRRSRRKAGPWMHARTFFRSAWCCTKCCQAAALFRPRMPSRPSPRFCAMSRSRLDTSPELQRIVARCLRKSPADRWQSMAEVKAALLEARGIRPAHVVTDETVETTPEARRTPALDRGAARSPT